MVDESFDVITRDANPEEVQAALRDHKVARGIGDHIEGASLYNPSDPLLDAVNTAIAVGSPLLVTGEPGTGKTQVAFWVARMLGMKGAPYMLPVHSETRSRDLLYTFDRVSWFHAHRAAKVRSKRHRFIQPGPLAQAYQYQQEVDGALQESRACVLIDEIDKAPRDFPNDLLHALDQHQFQVPEWDKPGQPVPPWSASRPKQPPIIIITSNSERRLPEAFLRRCIFHHIAFDPEMVKKAVDARVQADIFGALEADFIQQAIARFLEVRKREPELRKRPATAELLVWLHVLQASGVTKIERIAAEVPLGRLPQLGCLIKDRDDLEQLG